MGLTTRRGFVAAALAGAAPGISAAPQARYRTLGHTGLKVSELGFGAEAVSDPSVYQRALDLGINFFDTARNYERGNAERLLGKGLGARRKDVIVCGRSYADTAKELGADLDASLKAIGTDYFDVFYIGAKDSPAGVPDEMLEVQAAARKAGKIRFRGISTHRSAALEPLFKRVRFDVLLVPYNFTQGKALTAPSETDGVLEKRGQEGLGLVAMKVMAGGTLLSVRRRLRFEGPGIHLSALKWALLNPHVHSALARMSSMETLEENARAMREPFHETDARRLMSALPRVGPYLCRMCGACDGACPRGVPASEVVRDVMYAEGYGDFARGRSRFRALPAAVRQVRCADCTACAVRCPNGVRVRERLIRAQELFGEPGRTA